MKEQENIKQNKFLQTSIDVAFPKTNSIKSNVTIHKKQLKSPQIRLLSDADIQVKNLISDYLLTIDPIDKDSFDIESKLQEIKLQKEKVIANYDNYGVNDKLSDDDTWKEFKTMTKRNKKKKKDIFDFPYSKKSRLNQLSLILTKHNSNDLIAQLDKNNKQYNTFKNIQFNESPTFSGSNTQTPLSHIPFTPSSMIKSKNVKNNTTLYTGNNNNNNNSHSPNYSNNNSNNDINGTPVNVEQQQHYHSSKNCLTVDEGWGGIWGRAKKQKNKGHHHVMFNINNNNNSGGGNKLTVPNNNNTNNNNNNNSKWERFQTYSKKHKHKLKNTLLSTAIDVIERENNLYSQMNNSSKHITNQTTINFNNNYLHLNAQSPFLSTTTPQQKKAAEDAYAENLVNDLFLRPKTYAKLPLNQQQRRHSIFTNTNIISNSPLELNNCMLSNVPVVNAATSTNTLNINPFHTLCSEIHTKILNNMNISRMFDKQQQQPNNEQLQEKQKELKQTILELQGLELSDINIDNKDISQSIIINKQQNSLSPSPLPSSTPQQVYHPIKDNDDDDDASLLSEDIELRNRKLFRRYQLVYDSLSDEELDIDLDDNDSHYIIPHSYMKNIIESLVFIITLIYLIITPLQIAFIHEMVDQLLPFIIIGLIGDSIYLIDLISCFFTAYLNNEEQLIISKQLIALNYLQGWFLMDFIAFIPFDFVLDIIIYINPNTLIANTTRQIFIYSKLNFIHFLRLIKFIKIAKVVFNNYLLKVVVNQMLVSKYGKKLLLYLTLGVFAISIHVLCCIYIFLGFTNYPSWILQQQIQPVNLMEIYFASLHYVLYTVFGVGYGDILIMNINEKLFTLCLLQIGVFTYSWLVSTLSKIKNEEISSIQAEKREEYNKKLEMLDIIRVTSQNMNDHFYHKVQRYLYYQFLKELYHPNVILDLLPSTLKKELVFAMYRPVINNFVLFKYCTNEDFILKVITCFRPGVSIKNERILNRGDYIEEMMFVRSGKLAIELLLPSHISTLVNKAKIVNKIQFHLNTQNKMLFQQQHTFDTQHQPYEELFTNQYIKIIEIRKNEHFGDIGMFCNQRTPLSVRVSTSKAELFYLRKSDAVEISMSFPKIWKRILINSLYNINQINVLIKKLLDYFAENNQHILGFVKENNDLFFVETTKGLTMIQKKINTEENSQLGDNTNKSDNFWLYNNDNNNNGDGNGCGEENNLNNNNNNMNTNTNTTTNNNDKTKVSKIQSVNAVKKNENDDSSLISNTSSIDDSSVNNTSFFSKSKSNDLNGNNNTTLSDVSNLPLVQSNDELILQHLEHKSSGNLRKITKTPLMTHLKSVEAMFKHQQSDKLLKGFAMFTNSKFIRNLRITHFYFNIIQTKFNKKIISELNNNNNHHRSSSNNNNRYINSSHHIVNSNSCIDGTECATEREQNNSSLSICPALYNEIMSNKNKDNINNELKNNEQLIKNPHKLSIEHHKINLFTGITMNNNISYETECFGSDDEHDNTYNNITLDMHSVSALSSNIPLNHTHFSKNKCLHSHITRQVVNKFKEKDLIIDKCVIKLNLLQKSKGKLTHSLTNKIFSTSKVVNDNHNKAVIKRNKTGTITMLSNNTHNNNSNMNVNYKKYKRKTSAIDAMVMKCKLDDTNVHSNLINEDFGLLSLQTLNMPIQGNNGFLVKNTDNKTLQKIQNNIENSSLNLTNPKMFYSQTFLHMMNVEGKDRSGKIKSGLNKHFDSKLKIHKDEKESEQ